MKEKLKEVIILIVVLLLLTVSAFGQNQFSDYVRHIESTEDTTKLGKFINEWLGVRYRLGGSTKKGIDCSQFTKKLYRNVYDLSLGDVAYKQWNQTKRIKKDSLRVGDIVFFRSRQSPSGWHCGIYIGNHRFVHAANKLEGVKISTLDEPRYLNSYKGAGRLD
jgi:cell wall-associated NlpC family hydrolase